MTTSTFLFLLTAFSTITGLVVECIKKLVTDKANISWNITALIVALIVGGCGCTVYYQLNGIPFTTNNIIYAALMGLASAIVSMVGFDKFTQSLRQCGILKDTNNVQQ